MLRKHFFLAFFALLIASVGDSYSQRIKTVIFADTNDPTIGDGADADKDNMLNFVIEVATAINMSDKCETAIVKDSEECNTKNLKQVLKDLSCRGDIVFFAYFGHGSRAIDDKSNFPQMCLGSKNSDDFIPLEEVKRVLVAKGARLAIVLADCCNSPEATTKSKRRVLSAASSTTLADNSTSVFKKLFIETTGSVMAAGCQKGEYSWYYDEGSFFADAFVDEMENYSSSNTKNPTWREVASNITNNVIETSKKAVGVGDKGYVQTPIFEFGFEETVDDPKDKSKDDPKEDSKDNSKDDSIKDVEDVESQLKAALITVANDELEPSVRFKMEDVAKQKFSSNAEIEIVGRDHKTSLGKYSVEEFLDRISTAFRLRNFSILDRKLNSNNKFTYLKVHEIYINKK